MKDNSNLQNILFILGAGTLFLFAYFNFNPTNFLRVLFPILITASIMFIGIFAITEVRKTIKENYKRNTKNILQEINSLRAQQENKPLEDQIKMDEKILTLRQSLKGFRRNNFELCVIYSSIIFSLGLLSTFMNLEKIKVSNVLVMIVFFYWGLFYFIKMMQSIFNALNIVQVD